MSRAAALLAHLLAAMALAMLMLASLDPPRATTADYLRSGYQYGGDDGPTGAVCPAVCEAP